MAEAVRQDGVPAAAALVVALVVPAAVFAATLSRIGLPDEAATASATAAMLPIAAVLAAVAAVGRGGPPRQPKLEPALLGAIPMLLVATSLSLFGVARLGYDFSAMHLSSVAYACFGVAALMLAFGVRATTRHGAIGMLVLTLPPLTLRPLTAIEGQLTNLVREFARRMVDAFGLGVRPGPDGTFVSRATGDVVSIVSECGGIDALALTAVALAVLLVVHDGRWWAKVLLASAALLMVIVGNIMRVGVLLALHGGGHRTLFDLAHAGAGVVLVALVTGVAVLVAPRFELEPRWVGISRARIAYSPTYLATATIVLGIAGLACWSGQRAAMDSIDVTAGSRVRLAVLDAEGGGNRGDEKARIELRARGNQVRADAEFPWMQTIFGRDSSAGAYTILADGEAPVWAQVIVASSRRGIDRYAPLDCFVAHGARIVRARRVELPGGAGVLVDQRMRGHAFSALSWAQPVILPDGTDGWRRIVLFADAPRGDDQDVPQADGATDRFAFGTLNVLSPAPTTTTRGDAFGPSGRRVVEVANDILQSTDDD